jgi:hypothetical protein
MKIVTPLSELSHFEALAEVGADEFYCGFVPFEWLETYNMTVPINRREWLLSGCNICNYSSMHILKRMSEEFKIPIKITLNAHYYLPEQYEMLIDIIIRLIDIGFDTFIIADTALVTYLQEKGITCKIHMSGEAEVINHLSMSFYDTFPITRFVFPRKVTLSDMKKLIQLSASHKEFEAFYLNSFCQYSGGFCNSIHCDKFPTTCWLPNYIVPISEDENESKNIKATESTNIKAEHKYGSFGQTGCGICRIKELQEVGVGFLKVVGRGHSLESLKEDIVQIKNIIRGAKSESIIEVYSDTVRKKYFNSDCPSRCYYPEGLI